MRHADIGQFYQDSWLRFVDAIATLIDEDSEFVFDALDGKVDQGATNGTDHKDKELINYREEPTAFFFVLFGITFEALAARFDDSDALARSRRLDILHALKRILRPSVAGTAVYGGAVFEETMDLMDRMILTEGLGIQTVIVEIARNMCIAHPSSRKSDDAEDETLSDDIDQLFELTRMIVLVLAGLVPGLAESNRPVRAEISDEAVALIRFALDSLVDAAEVFPSIIKSDLHACIFHLFITILGTGSCQAAVVPTALPIFRRFLDSISRSASSETRKQIRSTLSRFLVILKNAQKRENEASLPCERNTLLASTILVTTAHSVFTAGDAAVSKLATEVAGALSNPMTTKTAAGCARTLLLMTDKSNAVHGPIAAILLPRLVAFLTTPADLEDLNEMYPVIATALVAFALSPKTVAPQARAAAYEVVLAALLARSAAPDTAARLVDLAAADATAFRAAVLRLNEDQRARLETVLKQSQSGANGHARKMSEAQQKVSIALRTDF